MLKNYLYLRRAAYELNNELIGKSIFEAFTQERDRLYLNVSDKEFPDRHLILSVDQNLPFLHLKFEHFKAKKNIIYFFEDFLPDKIKSIKIAENDRIIKIELEHSSIYFMIRGGRSNIFLIADRDLGAFKKVNKIDESTLLEELENIKFDEDLIFKFKKDIKIGSYKDVKSVIPFITKDIFNEFILRKESESGKSDLEVLEEIFIEFGQSPIAVFQNDQENRIEFTPANFKINSKNMNSEKFSSYNSALSHFFKLYFNYQKINQLKTIINKLLIKELDYLSSKLNNLKNRIEKGSLELEYQKLGNLLLANIYSIKKGMSSIEVEDYETNNSLKIKLDPKIYPKQNIEKYFEKARNDKINFEKSLVLFKEAQARYNELLSIRNRFEDADSLFELQNIKDILKISDQNKKTKKMDDNIKAWHYLIESKYHVYVGKDSKSNDLLTTKFAKQNDYWFHARGLPGSHVILRVENTKEVMPKNILKITAQIAAYHSKAKTAGTAPVAYTFAKFVYKKKGLDPGQVFMKKENVLLVKPEIPNSAELLDN